MAASFVYLDITIENELVSIVENLLKPGKGILAADESTENIGSKFKTINVENNIDNRCKYRKMLFSISKDDIDNISGVILVHETLYQKCPDGILLVDYLRKKDILLGIKVDKGLVKIPGTNETTGQGLDDLGLRCQLYKQNGCDFAKWRCVFKISSTTPSAFAINKNANVLAEYAAICQANCIVPIVEPELLMDGDHSLECSQKATEAILAGVFKALSDHHVFLEGILLKINMVTPGNLSLQKCTSNDVAFATVKALQRTVPPAVPGIVFLSGGQSEEDATLNLNAINKIKLIKPWVLSFSYGRALQASALRAWAGKDENIEKAQKELAMRVQANGLASLGQYFKNSVGGVEEHTPQYVSNYQY